MNATEPRRRPLAALAAGLLIATATLFAAAPASAALKHYDGAVAGTNENRSTFRLDTGNRTLKFRVNARTEFERIAGGLAGLDKGDRIEVDAKSKPNGLVARQVEPQGGSGGDDNGGNGSDDPPGDDHGQHGPNHD